MLAVQGDEGSGKGTLGRVMLQVFGAAALPVSDPLMLTGQFSGHLQHCCFLFVDEAFWAGDAKAEGRLKSLVTEKTITIRPLYVGAFQVRNMLHIMMASNNDWVVPAGHGARRYAVFKIGDAVVDDLEYFNRLNAEIDGVAQKRCCMISLDLISMGGTQNAFIKPKRQWNRRATHFGGLMPRLRQCFRRAHYQSPAPKYPNRCLSGGNRPMALEDFPRILPRPVPARRDHLIRSCSVRLFHHFIPSSSSLVVANPIHQGHHLYHALGGAFGQGVIGRNRVMILDRRRMVAKLSDVVQRLNLLVPADWVTAVDQWRSHQPGVPNRSEAIRRLVLEALEAGAKGAKPKGKPKG